jgi:hypothetical protein
VVVVGLVILAALTFESELELMDCMKVFSAGNVGE